MRAFAKLSLWLGGLTLMAWAAITYPAAGQLTYDLVSGVEARLYGLHTQRVQAGDVGFVVQTSSGQGEPILMLHGFTADKDVWARFARHFAPGHRVIIPDLPGHGETGYQAGRDHGVSAQVERLVALLDAMQVGRVHVIGNSMGGHIAAQFALDHPERTLTLAMIDPAGMRQPQPSPMRQMLAAGRNPFLIEARAGFDTLYPMTMAEPPFMPGFVLDAIAERYVRHRSQFARIFEDVERPTRVTTHASEITAPALLLWGRRDRLIDVSAAQVWQQAMPGLRVEIWDEVGHMPMVERPAATAALYRDFLASARR